VAEGYVGFQLRFSKVSGEIFDCDCNVQLSTAIQLFNTDSFFQLPQRVICNAQQRLQLSIAIQLFNAQLQFQLSTMIQFFNAQLRFQLSTAIQFFNAQVRLKYSTAIATLNRDSTFQRSTAIPTFNCDAFSTSS